MRIIPLAAMLAALFAAAAPLSAHAEPQVLRARYDATLWGLPIGRADITSRFEGGSFKLQGSFGSAGIARLFDPADGTATVSGTVSQKSVQPASYRLNYKSGKKRQSTAIRFENGAVADTQNKPPLRKFKKNWVPLADKDLKGVADPLTALMIPAGSASDVCDRSVDVYDGEMHARLQMSRVDAGDRLPGGQVTCRVRFVPVAGYRTNRDALKFLRDRARIFVAFAPAGVPGIQSPVEATIGTQVGTVHIRARAVEAK